MGAAVIKGLLDAAENGDLDEVAHVLDDHSVDITQLYDENRTLLTSLLARKVEDSTEASYVLSLLGRTVARGASVNRATTSSSMKPIHAAILHENLPALRLLLENGSSIDTAMTTGETPLFLAIHLEQPEFVHELLMRGADPRIGNVATGQTPFECATMKQNAEILEMLSFLLNQVDKLEHHSAPVIHRRPLHEAAAAHDVAVCEQLCSDSQTVATVNARDVDGFTPLQLACRTAGAYQCVRVLLDHGARTMPGNSASTLLSWAGLSPLCLSASVFDRETVALLLQHDSQQLSRWDSAHSQAHVDVAVDDCQCNDEVTDTISDSVHTPSSIAILSSQSQHADIDDDDRKLAPNALTSLLNVPTFSEHDPVHMQIVNLLLDAGIPLQHMALMQLFTSMRYNALLLLTSDSRCALKLNDVFIRCVTLVTSHEHMLNELLACIPSKYMSGVCTWILRRLLFATGGRAIDPAECTVRIVRMLLGRGADLFAAGESGCPFIASSPEDNAAALNHALDLAHELETPAWLPFILPYLTLEELRDRAVAPRNVSVLVLLAGAGHMKGIQIAFAHVKKLTGSASILTDLPLGDMLVPVISQTSVDMYLPLLQFLLKTGAKVSAAHLHGASVTLLLPLVHSAVTLVNTRDDLGTPLLHNVLRGKDGDDAVVYQTIKFLLDVGGDASATETRTGSNLNALHVLCSLPRHISGAPRLVRLLTDHGCSVNAQTTDKLQNTPLHIAVTHCRAAVTTLVDCGADVNLYNAEGHTPLYLSSRHLAEKHGSTQDAQADDTVQLFLEMRTRVPPAVVSDVATIGTPAAAEIVVDDFLNSSGVIEPSDLAESVVEILPAHPMVQPHDYNDDEHPTASTENSTISDPFPETIDQAEIVDM